MSDFTITVCFTPSCGAPLPGLPGVYYCDACVREQLAEHARERQAFEDYHRFADACAKQTQRTPEEG